MTTNGDYGAASWDEARQLGQLFMMGFDGTVVNDQIRTLIEQYHLGAILLCAKNLKCAGSPAAQTTQLVLDLQTLAHNAGHPVPLLIAIDQENGGVNSLFDQTYIRQFPSAMGLAATGSKSMAKHISRATAQELRACGINWILGPVMDVLTNAKNQPLGVRSFGDDPVEVSAYAVECLKGLQEGEVATCGKHFPSYGNLEFFGSPNDVPTITDTLEHLSQTALIPFRHAIAAGLDAMMVGGVAMSSANINVMHACLSEQVIGDLLRTQMRFNGVVVSECLEMEALSRNIGISGGTVMAFNAGCDLMLTCRTLSVQEEAINGLKSGLANGMIPSHRVLESVHRILTLKSRYTSWEKAFAPAGIEHLSFLQPLHTNLSTTAYNKSITVVRDQKGYLPLTKTLPPTSELLLLTPLVRPLPASAAYHLAHETPFSTPSPDIQGSHNTDGQVLSGEQVFRELGRSLARHRSGRVLHTSYTAHGLRPSHEALLNRASAVIVVTADAGRNLYQHGFTKHVATLCRYKTGGDGQVHEIPCIVVSVSSPFDFVSDDQLGTYICTYDLTETALQALVKVLYGELTPTGKLPGSFGQGPKPAQTRQRWLVEEFNEDRDAAALDALLKTVQGKGASGGKLLSNVQSGTFLIRNPDVQETHLIVRNSTTKELFGFCATYFGKSTKIGHVGALIVNPSRRKLAIGQSLHDRAIRALLQKRDMQQLKLGSRFPNVYSGIPYPHDSMGFKLKQWFTKLGWDPLSSTSVKSMVLNNLPDWAPPDGLGEVLKSPDVKYDLIHGSEHASSISQHVRQHASSEVQAMYQLALTNKEGCAVIRAKQVSNGSISGTLLVYRDQSKLAEHIPQMRLAGLHTGGLACVVLAEHATDKAVLLQGLMLLGARQLKKQGLQAAIVDHVADDIVASSLTGLGFSTFYEFETLTSEPTQWLTTLPP